MTFKRCNIETYYLPGKGCAWSFWEMCGMGRQPQTYPQ